MGDLFGRGAWVIVIFWWLSLLNDDKQGDVIFESLAMNPNDFCWCQSGKKYKKCHSGRDSVKRKMGNKPIGQLLDLLRKSFFDRHPV